MNESDQPSPEPRPSVLPVVEEQLEVQRRLVDTGRTVRVRKHVEEVPVDLRAPRVDHLVDIERVAVGRVISEPVGVRHEGDVLVIPVIEERAVTRTELVLVEEVRVTRRRQTQEMQAQLTLRRERVVVERFDPATGQWMAEDP